jgi:ATP-dependent RNA helicase HelY
VTGAADGPPRIRHDFPLDDFQVRAMDALGRGENVLVSAPTGSGKTVVAQHAVNLALDEGLRVAYTAPIKALSNQVHRDLVAALGREQVGLLTGDHSVRAEAPVVVMTTEVLRNMIYARSSGLDSLRWIVLDEVHFLQDAYRGPVWEEVLVHAPPGIGFVCLSATVSNADELGEWIRTLRGPTTTVVSHVRPVELEPLYLVGDRSAPQDHLLPVLIDDRPNEVGRRFDLEGRDGPRDRGRQRGRQGDRRFRTPRRVEVVERLAAEDLLPSITFVFSRAGCDDAARACLDAGVRLTEPEERAEIRAIAEERTAELGDGDLDVLGFDTWLAALEVGVASHHAGLVPAFRETVEACFVRGLVKVVFATETLALGINVPARSVVLERLSRFTGEHHEFLSAATFTQLTGRAGRRGIDDRGAAVVLWSPFVTFDQVARLAASRDYPLVSAFRPTYNMAANLVVRYDRDQALEVLGRSFAQFQADRASVHLRRRLDEATRALDELEPLDAAAESYVELHQQVAELRSRRRSGRRTVLDSLAALVPGDVVERPGDRGGRLLVVLSVANRARGGVRVRTCTPAGVVVSLHQHNVRDPIEPVARVDLPVPYVPADEGFRREAGALLRRVDTRRTRRSGRRRTPRPEDRAHAAARAELESHPVHQRGDREEVLDRARRRRDALGRLAQLERQIERRGGGLTEQLDSMVTLLESFGLVDGWQLTDSGERLRRTYHEADLLVCLAIEDGLFDGLDPPSLAGLCSCLTYEHRSAEAPPPPRFPTGVVRERHDRLVALSEVLREREQAAGLPMTRGVDPGFVDMAYRWTGGEDLASVLDEETTGGDFVRTSRQLVDLLRQVATLTADPAARAAARQAVEAVQRGVVEPGDRS